jgi:hypothetical protein
MPFVLKETYSASQVIFGSDQIQPSAMPPLVVITFKALRAARNGFA